MSRQSEDIPHNFTLVPFTAPAASFILFCPLLGNIIYW